MRIIFLHGWHSVVGGVKPTYLADAGHEVINPALDDDEFEAAVAIAQATFDEHHPDVVVGSSRGGAVAMNIQSGNTPLVLLCPAWKRWGSATTVKSNSFILHSRADEVVPFGDSTELVWNSKLPASNLVEIGCDHRLATNVALTEMLRACETFCQRTTPSEFSFKKTFGAGTLRRANYLSRLFGLFSEEIVPVWCSDSESPYEQLGRPTLHRKDSVSPPTSRKPPTLDFTFRRRSDDKVFVVEMKCEISLDNFRYLVLDDASKVERHEVHQKKNGQLAFPWLIECAQHPDRFEVQVASQPIDRVDGAILVWGSLTGTGRKAVMDEYGFADVVSIEAMITELVQSGNPDFVKLVNEKRSWSDSLFDALYPITKSSAE